MDVGELPMITFTVLAQMSVGAFIVLGLIQTFGSMKYSAKTIDRVADPALLAIGPTLVLGLIASMFHMNDLTNTFNVVRHFGTSWLSAEIVFGIAFAALGFLFAVLQWFKIGPVRLRQALAVLTALVGIVLIYCMAMIYYSLTVVPAWNNISTPLGFYLTAIILGCLSVGAALMITIAWGRRNTGTPVAERTGFMKWFMSRRDQDAVDVTTDEEVMSLSSMALRGIALTALIAGAVSLVRLPLYIADLSAQGGAAAQSAAAIPPGLFALRLILLAIGAGLMALFIYFFAAEKGTKNLTRLTWVTVVAFVLALISEFIGRSIFYHVMVRVGM